MSVIQALTDLLGGIDGIGEVVDNGLDMPSADVAAAVELDRETNETVEMAAPSLELRQRLLVSVGALIGRDRSAGEARDLVLAKSRLIATAILGDAWRPAASRDIRCIRTDFIYASREGREWAVATLTLEALVEEEIT